MKLKANLFLINALIVTSAIAFSVFLFLAEMRNEAYQLAQKEQEEALKTFWQILMRRGTDFRIADGRLMAGDYAINGNYELPDRIKEIFGGTATIFMGDTRVSTNVLTTDGRRAVGTKLIGPAYDAIFRDNRPYRGEAAILGIPYFTAYDPIRDKNGKTIGVLYVGVKKSDFLKSFDRLKYNMIAGTAAIEVLFIAIGFVLLWERNRYEELLRESEYKYRTLFESSADGIFLLDDTSTYLDCNEQGAWIFGSSRDEIIGRSPLDFSPSVQPDGRPTTVAAQGLTVAALAGLPQFFAWQHRRGDGTLIDAEISLKALKIGKRTVLQASVRDITKRLQAETRLQEVARFLSETGRETFFSSLVEKLARLLQTEYAFIGELAGDKIRVIASFAKGKPADTFEYALAGTPCAETVKGSFCFYPDGVARRYPNNRLLADMNAEGFLGIPLKLADGSIVGVMVVIDSKPLTRHSDAEPIFRLFAVRAAAELNRRRNEGRLREMAEQMRLITDSVPVKIAYVDTELRYRFVNRGYEEWFELGREEIVGRTIEEMLGREACDRIRTKIESALAGEEVTFVNQMPKKDGSIAFLQASYIPHRPDNNEVVGFFVLVTDITASRAAEETIRASEERYRTQSLFLQTLIDTIPSPIFYKDREGRYLGYNRSFRESLGLPDMVGKTVYDVAPKDLADKYHEMDEALFNAPGVQVYEASVLYADGMLHDVIFNKATFTNKDGRLAGLVGVILDVTERKKAEGILAEREEFLSNIINSIHDGISILDDEMRIIRTNPVTERRFSDRMPLEGRKCYEAYHGRTEPCEPCPSIETLQTGNPSCKIFSMLLEENQREAWLELYTFPLFDSKKSRVKGVIEYIRDVTERKRVEDALIAAEKKFRCLVEQSLVGTYIIHDGKFIYVNPKLAEIFGYTQDEIITSGKGPLDLTAEKDRGRVTEYFRRRTDGELQSIHYLFKGTRKDGGEIYAEVFGTRIEYGGKPVIIGTLLDVTDRMRAEEALRESEERFHQLFVQNDDAIVLFHMDTLAVMDANPAAEALTGYRREELRRLTISSFINPHDFERMVESMKSCDYSQAFQMERATGTKKDGSAMCIAIRGKILRLREEYVIHCSIRDITEKVRLEEEIRATQAKLIHANKMTSLGMLASSVAHEINNPNNCISVNASMLTDVWRDAEPVLQRFHDRNGDFVLRGVPFSRMREMAPKLFNGIMEGSHRITRIVDNMRDFVREDKSGLQGAVDINRLIHNAASILWHHIHKHTDNYRTDLQGDLPLARGSSQQIEQVVINLLVNALQALPDKRCGVFVATSQDPDTGEIVITVRDEGEGMGEKELERLTEPFFTTRAGGTGLGLYISASIVKEHKGSMRFASEPGKGTTVTVRLPQAAIGRG